jgi:hypothetical protein
MSLTFWIPMPSDEGRIPQAPNRAAETTTL